MNESIAPAHCWARNATANLFVPRSRRRTAPAPPRSRARRPDAPGRPDRAGRGRWSRSGRASAAGGRCGRLTPRCRCAWTGLVFRSGVHGLPRCTVSTDGAARAGSGPDGAVGG